MFNKSFFRIALGTGRKDKKRLFSSSSKAELAAGDIMFVGQFPFILIDL